MRCKDFLALHSDYRDGIITDPSMERRMQRHQAKCRSCAKYVQALEIGTQVLRDLDGVEPSARFRVNLRVRMALANRRRRTDQPPVFGWPARAAATALVVTVIVAGFKHSRDGEDENAAASPVIVSSTPSRPNAPAQPRPASPQFNIPPFHQPVGRTRAAAPHVTFSISEDSGYYSVPAILSR